MAAGGMLTMTGISLFFGSHKREGMHFSSAKMSRDSNAQIYQYID